MKKTLIASAVALATFASAGVSAQEVNLPKIYGNIQLTVADEYSKDSGESGNDEYGFHDNGSTLGFLHDHEITPGLTAFFKAEFEFNAVGDDDDGFDNLDEAYIGLKGDFGQIWGGKDDTLYEWTDVTDLYEYLGTPTELTGNVESRLIQYTTPTYNGLTLGAAVQLNDNQDGDDTDAYQLAAKYEIGDTAIALAFDSGDTNNFGHNAYGLGLTHSIGNVSLAAQYERVEDYVDMVGVLGAYTMGKTVLMASYHFSTYDLDDEDIGAEVGDTHTVSLQALHNLSDNFYIYVEGQWIDNAAREYGDDEIAVGTEGAEDRTLALGATYVF